MKIFSISKRYKYIFFILLALEVTVIVLLSGNELRFLDEKDYLTLAENIHGGNGYVNEDFEPTAFRAPAYPLFLSAALYISSAPIFIKFLQIIIFLGIAVLLNKILESYFESNGLIYLALFFYPVLAYTAGTLYPQILGAFFLVLNLYLLDKPKLVWHYFLAIGITWGILVLTIPTFIALVPILLLYIFWSINKDFKVNLLFSASLLLGIVLVLAPWGYRNYVQFDRVIPLTTNAGINLLFGNSENTKPNSGVNVDISEYTTQTSELNEVERNEYYLNSAIKWIKDNPFEFAELYVAKVLNYFNYTNELATKGVSNKLYDVIMFLTYYPFLLLSLIQLLSAYRGKIEISKFEYLLYTLYFGNAFIMALFFTRIRFRVPVDFLLILISGLFIVKSFSYKRKIKLIRIKKRIL